MLSDLPIKNIIGLSYQKCYRTYRDKILSDAHWSKFIGPFCLNIIGLCFIACYRTISGRVVIGPLWRSKKCGYRTYPLCVSRRFLFGRWAGLLSDVANNLLILCLLSNNVQLSTLIGHFLCYGALYLHKHADKYIFTCYHTSFADNTEHIRTSITGIIGCSGENVYNRLIISFLSANVLYLINENGRYCTLDILGRCL